MLLLSVLLTRRVKAISLPPHKCSNWLTVPFQSGKKQNKKNKTNPEVTAAFLTATPAAFVAWVSLWCTDCCSASTLQRCRNHEHLGTCGRTKRTLNRKCITVKKRKKKGILFSVASSQHLVKECLAGVLTTDLVAQQVNTFSIVDRWETLSGF